MRAGPALAASCLLLAAAGCGGDSSESGGAAQATTTAASSAEGAAGGCKRVQAPETRASSHLNAPEKRLDPSATYDAVLQTSCGTFTITLDQRQSPHATASFVALAKSGFFDGTTFHRIVPGFVIQGGDPTASGRGGPGYSTVDRPPASASYRRGVVAMAKTTSEAPGTAGSQFFVVTGANANLPPDYAVIGKVTKGMPVVLKIGQLGNESEQPTQTVLVSRVLVRRR